MNAFGKKVLLAPFEGGAGSGMKGRNGGPEMNSKQVAEMMCGSLEHGVKAIAMITNRPLALAYVAAYHENATLRGLALSILDKADALVMVGKSSPYYDTVYSAFEKAGKKMDELGGTGLLQLATLTPIGEDKYAALQKLKALMVGETIITSHTGSYTFDRHLKELRGESPAGLMNFFRTAVEVEKFVISSTPLSRERVEYNKGNLSQDERFSKEDFVAMLEGG